MLIKTCKYCRGVFHCECGAHRKVCDSCKKEVRDKARAKAALKLKLNNKGDEYGNV